MTAKPPLTGWIISHTHWDREWYRPFQIFRARLVDMIDELLDTMEREPRYRFFHLDGQTIVLDDYLEIRPENRARLDALQRCGRLLAGPWYVQPDEALPSGEALVRNLLLGTAHAAECGEPLRCGYLVDIFGHVSQMPQLLRGFGIDNAILFRGLNDDELPAEATWEGSDGSRVLLLRLPNDVAYSDFFYYVRHPLAGKPFDIEEALGKVEELVDFEGARSTTPELLLMDGVDHIEILPELPDLVDRWNADPARAARCRLMHGSLPEYLDALRGALGDLETVRGELRDPSKRGRLSNLFYGFHSSRVWIKQRNDRCESLLTLAAEPWAAAAWLETGSYPSGLLRCAWKHLLQNHPHDSICGCSIDQVHRDMAYRFDQCEIIGEDLVRRSRVALAPALAGGEPGQSLVLWNSSGVAVDEVVEVEAGFLSPRPDPLVLRGADGVEVPCQVLGERRAVPGIDVRHREIPHGTSTDFVRLALPASLAAVGAAALRVDPLPGPRRVLGSLSPAYGTLDNGLLRLEVAPNGTLALTDQRDGSIYAGLLALEDCGDAGDGWTYRPPAFDEVVTSHGAAATIALVEDGPLQATLETRLTLSVPRALGADGRTRGPERVDLPVTLRATLRKGVPVVSVRVEVDNTACDHRLRATFPSGLRSVATQWQDSAFDLVERQIALRDTSGWYEEAQEILPQQSLSAISDGEHGLAVIAPGLKESCVRDDEDRTIAVTLFRAFRSTVGTAGEPGPQILGPQAFDLAIVPFAGPVEEAGLPGIAQRMRSEVRASVSDRLPGEATLSVLDLAPSALVLSALKRSEDGACLVVRCWNPSPREVAGRIRLGHPLASARKARLDETPEEELAVTAYGYEVGFTAKPREVVTLRLTPAPRA